MGNPVVVTGAMTACSFGIAPSTLMVMPPRPLVEGRPAAVITDIAPMSNIVPFGMCTTPSNPMVAAATAAALGVLTPMPCVPLIVAPWTPMAPRTLFGNVPALVGGSMCTCAYGGVINLTFPGSIKTLAG